MGASFGMSLGERLGQLYFLYAMALLLGCVGLVHVMLLGGYRWCSTRGRLASSWFLAELLYGLLNPVVYLGVFQPALFRSVSPAWLTVLSWGLLLGYWGVRLLGPLMPLRVELKRRGVQVLLLACLALVVALSLRDLLATARDSHEVRRHGFVALLFSPIYLLSPLYLFPGLIAFEQLRRTRDPETWADGDGFFFRARIARGGAWASALLAAVLCVSTLWRPSERSTRELLLAHREDIRAVSARAGLDPRLLASILFVTHREHTTPLLSALEEVAVSSWLVDTHSHMLIAKALNPSLGLAHIKPVTVLTALWIHNASDGRRPHPYKEYREVPDEGDAWKRIPSPALVRVARPALPDRAGKEEVVSALLDPKRNLELSAFLLNLYAAQWEAARPEWSIRSRPDILATLYQIGFERSHPKPDPRPNAFGTRVSQVFHEPWMREHFGP